MLLKIYLYYGVKILWYIKSTEYVAQTCCHRWKHDIMYQMVKSRYKATMTWGRASCLIWLLDAISMEVSLPP